MDPDQWAGSWCSDKPTFPEAFLEEVFGVPSGHGQGQPITRNTGLAEPGPITDSAPGA